MDKHSCQKSSFQKVFLSTSPDAFLYQSRFKEYVSIIHSLADHTTHAFKYFMLNVHEPKPIITEEYFEAILYLLNKGDRWKPKSVSKKNLRDLLLPYIQKYCIVTDFSHTFLTHEQQSFNYLANSLHTNLSVNVQEHFYKMMLRYINLRLNIKETISKLKNKSDTLKEFYARVRNFKKIVLTDEVCEDYLVFTETETEVEKELQQIMEGTKDVIGDSIAYKVVVDPLAFVTSYCTLSRFYEYHGFPQFNAIPLRRSLIQSHIRFDTVILYSHILKISRSEAEKCEKEELWSRVFNLKRKVFRERKGLKFDGSITTDGTSVSVYLKHPEAKFGSKTRKKSAKTLEAEKKALYYDTIENLKTVREASNIVVIDPNKRDLIYCQDSNGETFRYTSNQRTKETCSRLYKTEREELRMQEGISEKESRIPTHKTMDRQKYVKYLQVRRVYNAERSTFYNLPVHNKRRWFTYIKTQQSEQKVINTMKEKFGNEMTVIMGDWSDAGHTMKFQASSKTKGWRTLFKRNGVKCFLIDEYLTSSICPKCNEKIEKNIKSRPSSRPWRRKEGKQENVHGLLGCNNPKCKQDMEWRYWNRDTLATSNMLNRIQQGITNGPVQGRPEKFSRK